MPSLETLYRTLRTGQFWYLFPHHLYRWLRDRDIEQTPPVLTTPYGESDEIPELHLLTGTGSVGDLLYAAKSFVTHYEAPLTLVIHGDGTLTTTDTRRLTRHFPNGRVFTKDERDEPVLSQLEEEGAEKCISFRKANVLAYKLLDVSILARSKHFIIMDTDCLAFQSLGRIQDHIAENPGAMGYMKDPQAWPYSVSRETGKEIVGTTLTPHVNSGLVVLPLASIEIRQIENWLSSSSFSLKSHFAEQTLYGFLASVHPSKVFSPSDYKIGKPDDCETVFAHYAAHYLSSTRISMRRGGQKRILKQLSRPE